MHVFLCGVVIAALLGIVAVFMRWRSRELRRLLSTSTIVHTSCGPIDCAFAGPDGAPAVLVLHGGLGGWDQAMALAEDLDLPRTWRVIAPSRPGYLRTPLSAGQSADDAAGAMVALLDALEVRAALVIGISGGGPTAVAIATRHSRRVRALVMLCAISHRHVQPAITTESLFGRLLFSNAGSWTLDLVCWSVLQLTHIAPAFMARRVLHMTELAEGREIRARVREMRAHGGRLRWLSRLLTHSFPISPRRIGLNNDLTVFSSLNARLDARITCPTLVVHGRLDGNVPVVQAEAVMRAADRAESFIIDDASHLLWLHPRIDEVRARVSQFFRGHEPA